MFVEVIKVIVVVALFTQATSLTVYKTSHLTRIWSDAGSGADRDCSIWRAQAPFGFVSVGDIVVGSHAKPQVGYLVKSSQRNDLQLPVSYSRIWNDKGSEADQDVQLWRVHCPTGFVALSDIATNGPEPRRGDIYCVNAIYTVVGINSNWKITWKDIGSGADRDVAIYTAVAHSNQVTVNGFGAVPSHNSYPRAPILLNRSYVESGNYV